MAKKAKHPKLPNGFGSIKKLSGNRSNPYAVYPPTKEFTLSGAPIAQPALCYVPDWYTGFHALMEYKNGTFDPENFKKSIPTENDQDDEVIKKIISTFNNSKRINENHLTFAQVYELSYKDKYENPRKKFSKSSEKHYRWAYGKCASLYDKPMKDIVKDDMQHIIDSCQLGYSSLSSLKDLFTQMCSYSMENGIINMDYSKYLKINAEKDIENGEPFTEHEIELLWQNKDNKYVQIILILIYTGMRGGELKATKIDYENKVFVGGLKTTAGRDRIIPFPDIIYDYILSFDQEKFSPNNFRDKIFYKLILSIGMDPLTNGKKHTPHDCRHTFSWLADKYKMDEVSKHLLMGHSLGKDVERSTYGHRTFEELKTEINKIEAPDLSLTCC